VLADYKKAAPEVYALKRAGHSFREIADITGFSTHAVWVGIRFACGDPSPIPSMTEVAPPWEEGEEES